MRGTQASCARAGGAGHHAATRSRTCWCSTTARRSRWRSCASAPTSWPRSWSSRCRAGAPTSSRASSSSELRDITEQSGALLIFDEVVTGFRSHPRGAQDFLRHRRRPRDLRQGHRRRLADRRHRRQARVHGRARRRPLAVRRRFDPDRGVTYFAGTFVRHPLALAAAQGPLMHLKTARRRAAGAAQRAHRRHGRRTQRLLPRGRRAARDQPSRRCGGRASTEDHPLQDLLFAMMRDRGIHILDNFPCFLTTAHTRRRHRRHRQRFKESVREMQEAEFLPRRARRRAGVRSASRRCPARAWAAMPTARPPGSCPTRTAAANTSW